MVAEKPRGDGRAFPMVAALCAVLLCGFALRSSEITDFRAAGCDVM